MIADDIVVGVDDAKEGFSSTLCPELPDLEHVRRDELLELDDIDAIGYRGIFQQPFCHRDAARARDDERALLVGEFS
ncbi:MAG TPA: hypothetical protein PLH21_11650 [Chiayiivirga sp.]|nr:hypothetical protein [Chiayiivirga sp.]